MNTVMASFHTTMRQMTELPQEKKDSIQYLYIFYCHHFLTNVVFSSFGYLAQQKKSFT